MSEKAVVAWMKSGKYLPPIMRDFHDQKDLFKAMHDLIAIEKHEYAKEVNWTVGHCYVIDIFLWFMARRGYTLQKSRMPLPFNDLQGDISAARRAREDRFSSLAEFTLDSTL